MPAVRFGVDSYQHRSYRVSRQQMVNCYLEAPPKGSDKAPPVICSFGIEPFAAIGTGIRGATVIDEVPYIVSGTALYTVTSNGIVTLLGAVDGNGPVDIIGEPGNVLVTAVDRGWIYSNGNVTQIGDVDFPGADRTQYLDGYAVVIKDGRIFINETPHDFSSWNPLEFASAESSPDGLIDLIISNRLVYFGGPDSIEFWENTGNADFPLERAPGGTTEIGVGSARAFVKKSNRVFLYSSDGSIYELNGSAAVPISTPAVAQAIEGYSDKTCRATSWTESDHGMIAFGFAEGTWVYDLSTQLWHERKSHGSKRWRVQFAIRAFKSWLVADSASGLLGRLSPDVFSEWGDVLRASCQSPTVKAKHTILRLQFQAGVGLNVGQGSDPQAMLAWSDDGGSTWGQEVWMPMGKIGQYDTMCQWNRLAAKNVRANRDRRYEWAISDPVRRTLVEATVE